MEILNKTEIKKRRRYFLTKAKKITKIRKGDKRVLGSRLCSLCGSPLSTVLLSTGDSVATKHHYDCQFSELFYVHICMDIRSCYAEMERKRRDSS